ncbi:glycosyltransferase [Rubellimicrobium roseum]|nr:glycosyltransferase family 2 protein [Rubellimicrobium roseum]
MSHDLDVLIPHYRDPAGLRSSLDSITQQTWGGRIRVVVVDDGSPEESFAEAEVECEHFRALGRHDLVLLRNDRNLGRPRTRNRLIDAIQSPYVAWLDAGDIWYPEKLTRQFEHLANLCLNGRDPNRIWVTCAYDWSQADKTRTLTQDTRGDQLRSLLIGSNLRAYLWTLLGTAEAFRIAGRFDERLPRLQDLDYFINFVRAGGQISSPRGREGLCCYFKSHLGRNAAEIHACYKLILAKNAPALKRYPPSLASELHYKAARLASQFAKSNDRPYAATLFLLRGALGSPRHTARMVVGLARRRLKGAPAKPASLQQDAQS